MSFISAIGVLCNILITAVVAVAAFEGTRKRNDLVDHHATMGLDNNGAAGPLRGEHRVTDDLVHWQQLPISIGIYVLSLAGHPSLPSLRKSMRRPQDFEPMLDCSFLIMFLVYVAMAVFGYLSFGDASAVLVTENLRRSAHSAASRFLNKVVIFFVALSSASTLPPLIAVTTEMYEDIHENLKILKTLSASSSSSSSSTTTTTLMPSVPINDTRANASHDGTQQLIETCDVSAPSALTRTAASMPSESGKVETRKKLGDAVLQSFSDHSGVDDIRAYLAVCLKRSFVLLLAFVVSVLCAESLGTFESVFGGICAINGSMILPAFFYMMLVGARLPRWQRLQLIAVVALGVLMLVSIVVMNVYDLSAQH